MAATYYTPGKYWGRITAQQLGKSKNKGTPQWCVSVIVLGTIEPNEPGYIPLGDQYDRTIFMYITEKTFKRFNEDLDRLCETAGIERVLPFIQHLDEETPGFLDLRGTELGLVCAHEQYEGATKERWWFNFGGGSLEVTKLDDNEIRTLNAMFGAELKKASKPAARAPAKTTNAKPQQAAVASGKGDIPF